MIRRENKRINLVSKFKDKREELRAIVKNPNATLEEKEKAQEALQKMPRDAAQVRRRNRCWMTGRGKGVYSIVGLCRNMFRLYAMKGDIPGIRKSSW